MQNLQSAGDKPRGSIAYVAGELPTETQTFIYREVRALRQRGWTVRTVSLNEPPDFRAPGLRDVQDGTLLVYGSARLRTLRAALAEAISHPPRSMRTFWLACNDAVFPGEKTPISSRLKLFAQAAAALAVARTLRRQNVRHIHIHFAHSPASVGRYAARQLGVKFSFTGHANDLFQRRALLRRKLESAEFVSCISRWHENFYRSVAPQSRTHYRLIRCGVDMAEWQPLKGNGRSQSSPATLRVLTACRVVEKKGLDSLIEAMHQAGDRGVQWQLTVAGDGPDVPRLREIAERLGCPQHIRWLGMVTNDTVRQLMADADLFVLPCRTDTQGDRDGIPVALMEAMACGVPVISGDLPSIRELIDNSINGILVEAPQTQAGISRMADAIKNLVVNPQERDRLAAAGRSRVEQEFSMERNIDLLEDALRQAMA